MAAIAGAGCFPRGASRQQAAPWRPQHPAAWPLNTRTAGVLAAGSRARAARHVTGHQQPRGAASAQRPQDVRARASSHASPADANGDAASHHLSGALDHTPSAASGGGAAHTTHQASPTRAQGRTPRATATAATAVASRPAPVAATRAPLLLEPETGLRWQRTTYLPDQLMPGKDTTTYDFPDGPSWEVVRRTPLAGGTLEIVRWEGRRMLRVWLPPSYDKTSAQLQGGLPSILLHDAQYVFGAEGGNLKTTWMAAETAAELIGGGRLPPFVIVAVDFPGMARTWEYTPYPPGTGPGGFRTDMEGAPGGGVWAYLDLLVGEVLPWATETYGLSQRPGKRIMGGSSFGGIVTLCAAIKYPHVWGLSLVESPSLWLAEERMLDVDLALHTGPWPSRVYVGMGGREFSGIRRPAAARAFPFADDKVASYGPRLGALLKDKGVEEVVVELQPDASHTNKAWAERLPRALAHLGAGW